MVPHLRFYSLSGSSEVYLIKPRTILLIDSNQSTRRQRVVMLVTHGYFVRTAEKVEDLQLPFVPPAPDLVLLRADKPPDRDDSAFALIRNAAPEQKIGFLVDEGHELCQLFVNGKLARAGEFLDQDLIQTVATIFDAESRAPAKHTSVGG